MKKLLAICIVLGLVLAVSLPAGATLDYVKWLQEPDMGATGMDFYSDSPWIMASDWKCEDGLPVTDFHWWGSWENNTPYTGGFDAYLMVFADQGGKPLLGPTVWEKVADLTTYPGYSHGFHGTDDAGNDIYWYQVDLLEPDWFHQDIGENYWFALSIGSDCAPTWGWHNTADHKKFDSVYLSSGYIWQYLEYPTGHSWAGQSADLAFAVSTVPEPATMLLLGSGLIGLAGLGRKKFFKKS